MQVLSLFEEHIDYGIQVILHYGKQQKFLDFLDIVANYVIRKTMYCNTCKTYNSFYCLPWASVITCLGVKLDKSVIK